MDHLSLKNKLNSTELNTETKTTFNDFRNKLSIIYCPNNNPYLAYISQRLLYFDKNKCTNPFINENGIQVMSWYFYLNETFWFKCEKFMSCSL